MFSPTIDCPSRVSFITVALTLRRATRGAANISSLPHTFIVVLLSLACAHTSLSLSTMVSLRGNVPRISTLCPYVVDVRSRGCSLVPVRRHWGLASAAELSPSHFISGPCCQPRLTGLQP